MSRYPKKISQIEVTTIMGCRLNCRYCPQNELLKQYKKTENSQKMRMTLEDFCKILPQIYENGTITFSGMSEVFQNHEASEMMKEAYSRGFKLQLFTTLQGMQEKDFENLADVEFETIVLHIPDKEGNSKFVIDEDYLENLRKFITKYNILYYSCHGEVHPLVKSIISSEIPIASKMTNRAGHLSNEGLEEHHWEKGRIACVEGVLHTNGTASGWTPMLLPNGLLLACCNDYGLELILGNLYTETWEEMINSSPFDRFVRSFDDPSIDILCRKCNRVQCREDALKRNVNIIWNNAIKVGRLFHRIEKNEINAEDVLGIEKGRKIKDLLFSKNVCIFGLGKLFFDTFDKIPWKNAILSNKVGICSDNAEKWKNSQDDLYGLQFVEPSKLKYYEDLVVVTYVSNDKEIRQQLCDMGICKIVNIYEIFNVFD